MGPAEPQDDLLRRAMLSRPAAGAWAGFCGAQSNSAPITKFMWIAALTTAREQRNEPSKISQHLANSGDFFPNFPPQLKRGRTSAQAMKKSAVKPVSLPGLSISGTYGSTGRGTTYLHDIFVSILQNILLDI